MSIRKNSFRSGESDEWLNARKWEALRLLDWLDTWYKEPNMDGIRLMSVRVNAPKGVGERCMVIVKGLAEDGTAVVCFGAGDTYTSALAEVKARSDARNLKWREDVPWEPRTP